MQLSRVEFVARCASSGASSNSGGFFRGIWSKIHSWFNDVCYTQIPTLHSEVLSVRQTTSIDSVIARCKEEDEHIKQITYDCEEDNPEKTSLSV